MLDSNFGRVVKAVALGAILVRGVGSNPTGCSFFDFRFPRRCMFWVGMHLF